jgi:capsular exopolysaccharide synthesis family protein
MKSRDVLRALWRRRLLVLLVAIATTLLSVVFALSRTAEYESVSTIVLTPAAASGGSVTPEALDALLGTYAQTAKSSLIRDKASAQLGEPLPASIETATKSGTGILQIIGTSDSAEGAASAATATAKAFIGYLKGNKVLEPQIVDPAVVPTSPVQPHPPLIIAIGILLGLIAGAMLAYFVEQFRGRVETTDDISDLTTLPIIGVLPNQRQLARGPSRLIWDDLELTALQEGIRALRTNVELLVEERKMMIQVTSALASEGKSMIVANLGVALAQLGIETMIVDADLRQPRQHEIFEIRNDAGLSTVLSGRADSKLRRAATDYPGLTVLPSGPIPPNATEMLHIRSAMLFEALRKTNALVLVDSPPVLPVSDARILAGRTDGVLLTVAAGSEKPSHLTTAIETLQFSGATIMGIVLNRSDDAIAGTGYGQYPASAQGPVDLLQKTSSIR